MDPTDCDCSSKHGTHETMPPAASDDKPVQDDFQAEPIGSGSSSSYSGDERRLPLQAFDYWHELKGDHDFPLFRSLTPAGLAPFRDQSLLVELQGEDAIVRFVGDEIISLLEGDVEKGMRLSAFASVSFARALLEQISTEEGQRQAVEFEFEEGRARCRGVILPFSSTGDDPHFAMVVANFRIDEDTATGEAPSFEAPDSSDAGTPTEHTEGTTPQPDPAEEEDGSNIGSTDAELKDTELAGADPVDAAPSDAVEAEPAPIPAAFNDRIDACKEAAGNVAHLDGGGRESLYQALAAAFALYEQAQTDPAAFAKMLQAMGLKMQARAPFTPMLKLTFGKEYDKTRLTEYAAALAYAVRRGVGSDRLVEFLENEPGGIKGCVRQERAARRGDNESSAAKLQQRANRTVRGMPSQSLTTLQTDDEFCLLIARRAKDGDGLEVVATADVGRNTVDAAIRRLADQGKNKQS